MSYNKQNYKKEVLLIQPPLLHPDMCVDSIQKQYWSVLRRKVSELLQSLSQDLEMNVYEHNFTGFVEPNIGLLYISSCLKQNGFAVRYLDLHLKDMEIRNRHNRSITMDDIAEILKEYGEDFIGVSSLTVNFGWVQRIIEAYKGIFPNSQSLLGGIHPTFTYEAILRMYPHIDYVIIGEGEKSTVDLLNAITEDRPLKSVAGVAYLENDRQDMVFTPQNEKIDLDVLPYPDYSVMDTLQLQRSMLRVITSRGCESRCSFCAPGRFFERVNYRDPGRVADELQHLRDTYGIRFFMIGDLNFLGDRDHARAICDEFIARDLQINWMCQARVNQIDDEIVCLMSKAGCRMLCIGIESGDQAALDRSNKGVSLSKLHAVINSIKSAQMLLFGFFMFGLPGETHESAHKTISLLKELLDDKLIDYTHCTVCTPYPGSDLLSNPRKYDARILSSDYDEYWMNCDYLGADLPVMETSSLSRYEIYAYWQLALATVAGRLYKDDIT